MRFCQQITRKVTITVDKIDDSIRIHSYRITKNYINKHLKCIVSKLSKLNMIPSANN